MDGEKDLQGLGGWLILVGLGIVFSPLRIVAQLFPTYKEVFTHGAWAVLTTPGNEAYSPLWAPILISEMATNVGLIFAWTIIAFLFFSKKRAFPGCYIGVLLFTPAFILVDAVAVKGVLPENPVFDADTVKELGRSLLVCLIWVPYMLVSKRVKATFVEPLGSSGVRATGSNLDLGGPPTE